MKIATLALLCLAGAVPDAQTSARSSVTEPGPGSAQIVDLPLADGSHQRVLYDAPAHPRATLVMLPGGSGEIGLGRDGAIEHGDNFVVRTRRDWIARGYAVLIPDTVDRANLRGSRSSPTYAHIIVDLAGYAQARVRARVFLFGTSQGSIAAMNGAAHAPAKLLAGVVLTESVSVMGRSGETVFDADPAQVRVPALIVANRDDECDVAPPQLAPRIAAAMSGSPDVHVMTISGGVAASGNPCGSLSAHGFYGIEPRVTGAIAEWLRAHGG